VFISPLFLHDLWWDPFCATNCGIYLEVSSALSFRRIYLVLFAHPPCALLEVLHVAYERHPPITPKGDSCLHLSFLRFLVSYHRRRGSARSAPFFFLACWLRPFAPYSRRDPSLLFVFDIFSYANGLTYSSLRSRYFLSQKLIPFFFFPVLF